jgi:hypothetical protein
MEVADAVAVAVHAAGVRVSGAVAHPGGAVAAGAVAVAAAVAKDAGAPIPLRLTHTLRAMLSNTNKLSKKSKMS